jgi:hypothetical protein
MDDPPMTVTFAPKAAMPPPCPLEVVVVLGGTTWFVQIVDPPVMVITAPDSAKMPPP